MHTAIHSKIMVVVTKRRQNFLTLFSGSTKDMYNHFVLEDSDIKTVQAAQAVYKENEVDVHCRSQ